MRRIKQIIKKILCLMRNRKIIIPGSCVFVNQQSWEDFDGAKFCDMSNVLDLEIVCGNPLLLRKKDYNKIVAYIGNIEPVMLHQLDNLKWLQLASHGYNGFEKANLYGASLPIVSNLRNVFSEPISDFCIASFYYFHSYSLRNLSAGRVACSDLKILPKQVSVLIIGLGNIGMVLAQKCKQLGWSVIAIKKNVTGFEQPTYVDQLLSFDHIDEVLHNVDYVVNLLPETEETQGIYTYEFFGKMKASALFCNVGRGTAVNDVDIDRAVSKGMIAGAILDASISKKYKSKNIIVTHHTSYVSAANRYDLDQYYTSQLMKFLSGDPVENTIMLE